MASGVLLQSLGNGAIWDNLGNALNNHSVFVYLRGTTTQVQVYSDATLTTPLAQPLLTGASGAGPGGIPGYVAGGRSLDFLDSTTGARTQAEPESADVLTTSGRYTAIAGGIPPNQQYAGSGAAINTWLASLPLGSKAVFPPVPGSSQSITQYWVDRTIIIPAGITLEGASQPYASSAAFETVIFSVDLTNWTGPKVVIANGAMTSNVQAANGCTNFNPSAHNVGVNVNGGTGYTAFAFIHPTELSDLDGLFCFPAVFGGSPSGLIALLIINNGDTPPNGTGFARIKNVHGYGPVASIYTNIIVLDASNNGTITNASRAPIAGFIIEFTGPSGTTAAQGLVCTDSPVKVTCGDNIIFRGLTECMPPAGVDTAGFRLIDCGQIILEDFWYESDSFAQRRPLIKATLSGQTMPALVPPASPKLENVRCYNSGGWFTRTDASCGLTATNTTITDASITAADQFSPVYGPGIPSGAYVATVSAGVSFTVQDSAHAPFITATVSLNIGANVIEDEVGVVRHFQWHATYFDPKIIYSYTGPQCDWLQGPNSAPLRRYAQAASANADLYFTAPNGAIGETYPRAGGSAATAQTINNAGTLLLVEKVLYPGDLVTSMTFLSSTTALNVGTHQWAALFGPAREELAISADATSGAWAGSAIKAFAMGTAYSVSLPSHHYLGLCIVATTAPTLASVSNVAMTVNGVSGAPLVGTSSTGLSTPATCPTTASAPGGLISNMPYAYIT